MIVQAVYLENITMDKFREGMCDRCVVTNVDLDEGHALELCHDCPMNCMYLLGNMNMEGKRKDGRAES